MILLLIKIQLGDQDVRIDIVKILRSCLARYLVYRSYIPRYLVYRSYIPRDLVYHSYIPRDCSKRLAPWKDKKYQHAAITARRLFVHISVYSFIQLSELWQRGVNEIAKVSKRQQQDSNPGSLD